MEHPTELLRVDSLSSNGTTIVLSSRRTTSELSDSPPRSPEHGMPLAGASRPSEQPESLRPQRAGAQE